MFLPLETQTRIWRGKFTEEIRPFFPGYLFIGVTHQSAAISAIRSTCGVSQLVQFGNEAAKVNTQLVEEIRSRCNSDGLIKENQIFQKGEKVRVSRGPFANLIGEVERTTPNQRVWLLLDQMEHKIEVSIAHSRLLRQA